MMAHSILKKFEMPTEDLAKNITPTKLIRKNFKDRKKKSKKDGITLFKLTKH
jgi:hypothetical protein